MGMIVYVYRNCLGDCTNGGISSDTDRLCVVNIDGPFKPSAIPAVILTTNYFGNPILKPAVYKDETWKPADGWFMFGGNYAAISDSRFGEALRRMGCNFYGAIPIHDRQE